MVYLVPHWYIFPKPLVLPQELVEHIIGHLQDDPLSLERCSLVCRSWLFASRKYHFQTLVFNPHSVTQLLCVITTPEHSTITPYVKEIRFEGVGHNFGTSYAESRLWRRFMATLSLTHLFLGGITFTSFDDLLDVICGFPLLKTLQLDHIKWTPLTTSGSAVTKRLLPTSVAHLQLTHIPLQQISKWLLSHPKLIKVSRIEVGPIEEEDILCIGAYMSSTGPSIEHLSYIFGMGETGHGCLYDFMLADAIKSKALPDHVQELVPTSDSTPAYEYRKWFGLPPCIYLSAYVNLRFLRIDRFLDINMTHQSTALFWAPRIFASIRADNLTHIALGLVLSRAGDLDIYGVNWGYFDRVLSSKAYSSLRHLEFEVGGRVNIEGMTNLISCRLPLLAHRGVFLFSSAN